MAHPLQPSSIASLSPLPGFEGVFELHLTVGACEHDKQDSFRSLCQQLRLKPVLIEAPGAHLPLQPMTSSYHRGTLPQVVALAGTFVDQLNEGGFPAVRCKIEATLAARGVPADDAQARALGPGPYFEFHTKVLLPSGSTPAPLRQLCESLGARLSSNAFRRRDDGLDERFVTLRARDVGRGQALARFGELLAALRSAGLTPGHLLHEFTVVDTDTSLDHGWLALPDPPLGRAWLAQSCEIAGSGCLDEHPVAMLAFGKLYGASGQRTARVEDLTRSTSCSREGTE